MSFEKLMGRKGKVIHSQGREIIANVMKFMKEETINGIKTPLSNFRERVLASAGISLPTYKRIDNKAKEV